MSEYGNLSLSLVILPQQIPVRDMLTLSGKSPAIAKRRGYENLRLEKMTGLTPEQVAAETESQSVLLSAEEERHAEDRQAQGLAQERQTQEMEREDTTHKEKHEKLTQGLDYPSNLDDQ